MGGSENLVPIVRSMPQSEIRVKLLACQVQNTGESEAKVCRFFCADFRPSISMDTDRKNISHKLLTHHFGHQRRPRSAGSLSMFGSCKHGD